MKKFIIIVFITSLCFTQSLFSQQDTIKSNVEIINTDSIARNAWYIEIMGNTWSYSFNYDRAFLIFPTIFSDYTSIFGRIGLGINLYPGHVPLPVLLLINFGKIHRVEFGLGFYYDYLPNGWSEGLNYPRNKIKWILNIGYRYQKLGGGFVCRAGFTPIFYSGGYYHFGGVSFGYAW